MKSFLPLKAISYNQFEKSYTEYEAIINYNEIESITEISSYGYPVCNIKFKSGNYIHIKEDIKKIIEIVCQ